MVWRAGEGQRVDVGQTAPSPVLDVVNLAQITGCRAARRGAAALLGMQHDSLIRRGYALGAAEVEWAPIDAVEQAQVVVGVAGHPDQIRDGQQGAARGDGVSGPLLELLNGGGGDDRDGQAAVGAQVGVAELGTHQCH